ncbi:ribosome-releasing factor 2, mitochondrial-like isoform X2 [Antedon mediterranea]|uniref:ribosome-releasing factor 2, mitochondrial-like isoform X2 n=1 Tax=Antedon mediterranea TaxID=105859 RepID=UPI003AF94A6C
MLSLIYRTAIHKGNTLNKYAPLTTSLLSYIPCMCHCHRERRHLSLKSSDAKDIRNIGIMAHIDAGKTTTTERILFYSGQIKHLGDVDDGDTVTDYLPQERDRGITITSAAVTYHWKDYRINLIDTPGHVDFTVEVERCLRVLDGAVAVFDASAGVEAQTLTVWRQANNYQIPRIAFLNKMDKHNADFEFSIQSIKEKLQVKPLILQLPLGKYTSFEGVIDVVTMETVTWNLKDDGRAYVQQPVDKNDAVAWEQVVAARTALVEDLVELDEEFGDKVLETDSFDPLQIEADELKAVIRRVTLGQGAVPVLCGSSLKNKGVQLLMDAFKIVHDKHRGPLVFLRIYSGELKPQSALYNLNRGTVERISRLLEVFADEHREVHNMTSGNIAVAVGMKQTITGDTLVSSKSNLAKISKDTKIQSNRKSKKHLGQDVKDKTERQLELLPGLDIPQPVFFCTIEAPSMAYQDALDNALECIQREDPSLQVKTDEETGQTVLSGMGELHLEIIHDRIKKEYKIDADLGPLQISYREMITEEVSEQSTLETTIGEQFHMANIGMKVIPTFELSVPDSVVFPEENDEFVYDQDAMDAVENGALSALSAGPRISAQVLGVEVVLESLHVAAGTSLAIVSACAAKCIQSCLQSSESEVLEPMMNVEVTTDQDRLGAVLGDLSKRRGHIIDIENRLDCKVVVARTPLAEMLGYATSLRTITSGTATFTLELSSYERMSQSERDALVKKLHYSY